MTVSEVLLKQDARRVIESRGTITIKNLIFNQEVRFNRDDINSFCRYRNLQVLNYMPLPHKQEILILTTVDLTIF